MDKNTIGIVLALMGGVSFLYSFSITTNQQVYFWVGLGMIVGGLLYAKYATD